MFGADAADVDGGWSVWDRRFCVLALADHGGDLAAAGAATARDTCVAILEGRGREWTAARVPYSAGQVRFRLDTVQGL